MSPQPTAQPAAQPADPAFNRRLLLLFVVVTCGLCTSFLLPRRGAFRDSVVNMRLPEEVGLWRGVVNSNDAKEREVLGDDINMQKKSYVRWRPGTDFGGPRYETCHELNQLNASIILSGTDLNESIHRLERCLEAQGFRDLQASEVTVKVGDRDLKVTRIASVRPIVLGTKEKPFILKTKAINYYFFGGSHTLTNDHWARTVTDMKDRIIGGFDQQWGYVLVGGFVTDDLAAQGVSLQDPIYGPEGRSAKETDAQLFELLRQTFKDCISTSQLN